MEFLKHPPPSASLTATLAGHGKAVTAVGFSPDGRLLASGGADRTVILWDVTDRTQPRRLVALTDHVKAVQALRFSPDGRLLASGSADRTVVLWDVTNPDHPTRRAKLPHPRPGLLAYDGLLAAAGVHSVGFNPHRRLLACGSDRAVLLWDITDPAHPARRATLTHRRRVWQTGPVKAVAFSPDGQLLATGCRDAKNTTVLWNVTDADNPVRIATIRTQVVDWAKKLFSSAEHTANAVEFSPDGRLLAIGSGDFGYAGGGGAGGSWSKGAVTLWEVSDPVHPVRTADLDLTDRSRTGQVYAVAFSPDGRSLASCGADKTIRLWDVG